MPDDKLLTITLFVMFVAALVLLTLAAANPDKDLTKFDRRVMSVIAIGTLVVVLVII